MLNHRRSLAAALLLLGVLAAPVDAAPTSATQLRGWAQVAPVAGEDLVVTLRVVDGVDAPRRVLLQHRAGPAEPWAVIGAARSRAAGRATVGVRVPAEGQIRAVVRAARGAAGTTTRAVAVAPAGTDAGQTGTSSVVAEVLRLTNRLRAAGTTCGGEAYPPVPALRQDGDLAEAAQAHARDMAQRGYFAHDGRDGSTPGSRARAAGYDWRAVGENIAAGQPTAAAVVQAWQRSEGHCRNIMRPYADLGVGFVEREGSPYGTYWVQLFGTR